jgi:bisphosphoglycerate-dependent phosphoglycerate mutase
LTRRYGPIWRAIKAAKVGEFTQIRCHATAVRTLIQGVKKVKTEEVAQKKMLSIPTAGNLIIKQELDKKKAGFVLVSFALEWDGDKL